MRRLGVVLGVAVVMAAMVALTAGAALAQAETGTVHIRDDTEFVWFNPCVGEEILFEGEFRQLNHDTLNENGAHTQIHGGTIGITGTGLETGDTYRFINPNTLVNHQVTEDLFISHEGATQLLVSNGDSPNTLLHIANEKFTFRYVPNGEPQFPEE